MRDILKTDDIHPAIQEKISDYQSDLVEQVKDAVAENRIVVIGMRYNDSVYRARKSLTKAGLDFTYLEYGSYVKGWYRRLALKIWTGFPTFPMIFIDQKLIGGHSDLKKLLAENQIKH